MPAGAPSARGAVWPCSTSWSRRRASNGAAVVDLMRQEARQQAEEVIARHADTAVSLTGQPPAIHIREGKSRDELIKLLTEDRSISVLVLGSASSSEGPGPLVTAFAGKPGSQLRIPLTIVPGALTEAEIDAIS